MSEFDAPHLDDELLSAYLDDELSPAERARVESRLAIDPAARQLLEELRAVSQAINQLPPAALEEDLREPVLRRAEREMLASDSHAPHAPSAAGRFAELVRRVPIGRSRRAWFWAGAAIAAGLLIMIVEREPAPNADLPREVARRDAASEDRSSRRLEMEAVDKPPAERSESFAVAGRPATASDAPAPPVFRGGRPLGDAVAGAVGGAAPSSAGESPATADALSRAAPRDADADEGEDTSSIDANVGMLVVNIQAKPEALQQRLFDEVLARNGIVVEEPVAVSADEPSRAPAAAATRSGNTPAAGEELRPSESLSADKQPQLDVVLVEAAPAQIAKCLAEIDADRSNYLGIEVDDLATADRAEVRASPRFHWKQHERGVVPKKQQLRRDAENKFYLESDGRQIVLDYDTAPSARNREPAERSELAAASPRAARAPSLAKVEGSAVTLHDEGRFAPENVSGQRPGSAGFGADWYTRQKLGVLRRGAPQFAAKTDLLQVLFVLSASEESPASPPPEQGFKIED